MTKQKTINLSYAKHRQQQVVRIDFDYDAELTAQIRQLEFTSWRSFSGFMLLKARRQSARTILPGLTQNSS
jgi:hypothetical protein